MALANMRALILMNIGKSGLVGDCAFLDVSTGEIEISEYAISGMPSTELLTWGDLHIPGDLSIEADFDENHDIARVHMPSAWVRSAMESAIIG